MSSEPDLTSLRGRSVVVTGCTRGFGRVLVTKLAAAGARVVVSGPDLRESEQVAAELNAAGGIAVAAPGDVTSPEDVRALVDTAVREYGVLDVWVNNAAYEAPGMAKALDLGPEMWERITQVNVVGTGRCTVAAFERMREQGHGVIVNVTGRGDDLRPTKYSAAYGASKAWIRMFTKTLRAEYGDTGVELVAFNPGMMTTKRLTGSGFVVTYPESEKVDRQKEIAMRILADPPEVAAEALVRFLAENRAGKRKELRLISPKRIARGLGEEVTRRIKR